MPTKKKKLAKGDLSEQEAMQEVEEIEEKEVKEEVKELEKKRIDVGSWVPKSSVGKKIKEGEIRDIDDVLEKGLKILEPEIVDVLVPNLEIDLLMIGQSKGKFGGGQKRVFRQTQKKTKEGNKPHFATMAVVGNSNGYVGVGYGKSRETVPSREKAIRKAKLNIFKIRRGCGSWQCGCKEPHTIPYMVAGKCGSSVMKLIPAPKGTGLIIVRECAKILRLAGIKDVWTKTFGQTRTDVNLIYACVDALKKLSDMKIKQEDIENLGLVEGRIEEKHDEK